MVCLNPYESYLVLSSLVCMFEICVKFLCVRKFFDVFVLKVGLNHVPTEFQMSN